MSAEFTHTPAAAAKSLQLCPTLCDPIDGSPPGSPVPGILQARTLEWGAIAFSAHTLVSLINLLTSITSTTRQSASGLSTLNFSCKLCLSLKMWRAEHVCLMCLIVGPIQREEVKILAISQTSWDRILNTPIFKKSYLLIFFILKSLLTCHVMFFTYKILLVCFIAYSKS